MQEKSVQIAIGGVFSSLCLLLMFSSSVIPFSAVFLPMLAGATLGIVVIENGEKTALLVYISVSLLSIFIVPDPDAKLLFISFFGYYCVIRPRIQLLESSWVRFLIKFLIFNISMVAGYLVMLKVFGLDDLAEDSVFLGQYMPVVLLIGSNISFILYDFLLDKYLGIYVRWFRPTFLRR